MTFARKFKSFLGNSGAERRMICEAILMVAIARIVVLTVPFRLLAKWLERAPDVPGASDHKLVASVRKAMTTAARNVPWKAACLPQAIGAKAMLARRGHGSSLHLGATFSQDGKLVAHAWLECDGQIVTGAPGMHGMARLATFG